MQFCLVSFPGSLLGPADPVMCMAEVFNVFLFWQVFFVE